MSVQLKVKIKTLASEGQHIKAEEKKALWRGRLSKEVIARELALDQDVNQTTVALGYIPKQMDEAYDLYWNLHQHRMRTVRRVARNTLIAYGFLRGLDYSEMETDVHNQLTFEDWEAIEKMVLKYADGDSRDVKQSFAEWKHEAGRCIHKDQVARAERIKARLEA